MRSKEGGPCCDTRPGSVLTDKHLGSLNLRLAKDVQFLTNRSTEGSMLGPGVDSRETS